MSVGTQFVECKPPVFIHKYLWFLLKYFGRFASYSVITHKYDSHCVKFYKHLRYSLLFFVMYDYFPENHLILQHLRVMPPSYVVSPLSTRPPKSENPGVFFSI